MCDLLQHGEVISIDSAPEETILHPRVSYYTGSSAAPDIVARVKKRLQEQRAGSALIILDSDHTSDYVRRELEAYAPLVPLGSLIHVQDGCIDELPCFRFARPGPKHGIKAFLKAHPEFIRDIELERRYAMTFHPYGWLKRVVGGA